MTGEAKQEGRTRPSVRMSRDEAWAYVRDAHTGILTTLRSDGVPIALPLWFAALDGCVYFRTRGKKLRRIERDPRASFLVEAGERWVELSAVHHTGRAEIVELDAELSERFRRETERKYGAFRVQPRGEGDVPGRQDAYLREHGAIVRFIPDERVLSWDNARLGLA